MHKQVLVLGSGQLARMMAIAGAPLNIQVVALDVNTRNIIHPLTGMPVEKSLEALAEAADAITAEFEHIPHDILEWCGSTGRFFPTVEAIKAGGDRRLEKQLLASADIKSASYRVVQNRADFDTAIASLDLPIIFKSALGGYDGKGQWRLTDPDKIEDIWGELEACLASTGSQKTGNQGIIAEQCIAFDREVSVIGARDSHGNIAVYPITENKHVNGVLNTSVPLDQSELQAQAEQIFSRLSKTLNYVGILSIELFDVAGELLVNEIAPRVHNSGHWSIEGAETSQFENHLRAICKMPLGSTRMVRPTAMVNLLGVDKIPDSIYSTEGYHVHWYGKEKRPGRKMGHINICSDNLNSLSAAVTECNKLCR